MELGCHLEYIYTSVFLLNLEAKGQTLRFHLLEFVSSHIKNARVAKILILPVLPLATIIKSTL